MILMRKVLCLVVSITLVFVNISTISAQTKPTIIKVLFGEAEGKQIYQYTLKNNKGMLVKVINYGATITDIITPDRSGEMGNVVLGFDSLKQYLSKDNARMGAIRGRVTNRIANNKFTIDGKEYKVITNKNGEVLGLNKRIWDIEELPGNKEVALKVTYLSKDGEEGFPGNLNLTVIYTLTNNNELKINNTVTTDQPTPVVLTSHSYFNLSGGKEDKILNTQLQFYADRYLETGKGGIPNGNIVTVKDTPFDFTYSEQIGKRIPNFNNGDGYDLTYALNNQTGKLALAAVAYEPTSGRVMQTYTTEPGVVFYTGNGFNNSVKGKGGKPFAKHGAFCLETQHYPDSPNQTKFLSVILRPGDTFRSETVYQFSVRK
jgi:aldose 1-epimerase